MYNRCLILKRLKNVVNILRKYTTSSIDIRNIGILAHIDAGKTTTTERMLFYSGKTRNLGEVHHGNTVTDYLAQERERGITICSSAVTFPWNKSKINLLDTPGHIDFTMEVEQSLYAVDGVVVVLDGSAGVEAQTVTVWSQSERHQLPKIIFVNKMDRSDADLMNCITDIHNKLDTIPVYLQLPVKNKSGLSGVIDIVELHEIVWNQNKFGQDYVTVPLKDDKRNEVIILRNELIDKLCTFDDELAESVILNGNYENISNELIWKAIRKSTCNRKMVPVLLGSAYKNIGIQPLMNAIIKYLPKPNEGNDIYKYFGDDLVCKVFKIVYDKQKGPLTLVRIFRGALKKGMRLISINGKTEVVQKLYEPLADEYKEILNVNAGDVAVCSGLKNTVTGDLLLSSTVSLKNAEKSFMQSNKNCSENKFSLEPHIPDAVYFCSIEPPSLSYQNPLEIALKQLQREDPSLRVNHDETTGQTVLSGMGELHMEIIKSRILTEYKIDADLGPLQIAYKETVDFEMKDTFSQEKVIAGIKQSATITMSLLKNAKEIFSLDNSPENLNNLSALRPRTIQTIKKGALSALDKGPRLCGQVIDTQIRLHSAQVGRNTADSFLMATAAQCVQKILLKAGIRLLEPMMSLQIIVPSENITPILGDLGRRRANIKDVQPKGSKNTLIDVVAPLAELVGYSSILRTISSGTASMTMQPCGYTKMNTNDEEIAIRRAQGLE